MSLFQYCISKTKKTEIHVHWTYPSPVVRSPWASTATFSPVVILTETKNTGETRKTTRNNSKDKHFCFGCKYLTSVCPNGHRVDAN